MLLGGLGAAALSGCASTPPDVAPTASARPEVAPEPASPPAPVSPAPPPFADVEQVIAAHEGLRPTAWGVDIPGVVRTAGEAGSSDPDRIILTLDACGGPSGSGADLRLIDGLRAAAVPALLFLNLRWMEANPALTDELAADPLFELGNHGSAHLPLSVDGQSAYGIPGTRTVREAAMEVWENHLALTELLGHQPRWFRPGTAHLDDVARSITEGLGERVLGFTVNGDGGATFSADVVAAEISAAAPGSVVLAHMNHPGSGTAEGILRAVEALRARGLSVGSTV